MALSIKFLRLISPSPQLCNVKHQEKPSQAPSCVSQIACWNHTSSSAVLRTRKSPEKRKNLHRVAERTAEATGASRKIASLIRTEFDAEGRNYSSGKHVSLEKSMEVPPQFCSLMRQVVRKILLQKRCVSTIDNVFSRLRLLEVKDVNLKLFPGAEMPPQESLVWKYSRVTIYRFMNSVGFICGDRTSHYERAKSQADFMSMRDNYLDWISKYREPGYRIQ